MTRDAGRRVATVAEARALLGSRHERAARPGSGCSTSRACCPGGYCSLLLADYGAEVLKVEDTGARRLHPLGAAAATPGAQPSAASALFLALNRGKRSIRLNLKVREGQEVLLRLVREHDVLLESFRPGVLDRLGVGYERLRAENPGLVYCAITGYGQDGPDRDRPGHDLNYLARGGLLGLTGERGGPPVPAAGQIADLGGGALMAAFGDPRRAARARALRRGPARRRRHDPRRAELAGDGRGPLLRRRRRAAARRARAGRRARLLPALRVRRRLGRARRARAEVLAGAVRGPRPRGPASTRQHGPGGRRRAGGGLRGADPRRVGGVRRRAPVLPGARARPRRGARRAPERRRRGRPARRGASRAAARPARRALAHARRTARGPARRSAPTPTRCSPPSATTPTRSSG